MFEEFEIIDTTAIKDLQETMGDKIGRMFDYFVADSAEYVRRIEDGFSSSNVREIIEASHTLKSSSKLIGAMRLSKWAELIEFSAKEIEKSININQTLPSLKSAVTDIKSVSEITLENYKDYRLKNSF